MNENDISKLSYKELQALALKYRVPGNIKKKVLVRVLQAAKGGNDDEVDRLLQDLKHTRKKKEKKLIPEKLGITSTPIHTVEYAMTDDYYCQQQQPVYQWVGAEEEIVSREDDNRIPQYEEFQQFLLKKIQKEFQTYEVNNNQTQQSDIVDLRTATISSGVQSIALDSNNYTKSANITDVYTHSPVDPLAYQVLEDTNGNLHRPLLLKKMLQAPIGANLGEIASPVFGNYRTWPVEECQQDNLLDNSDTLTAESENSGNEDTVIDNTDCYGFFTSVKNPCLLSDVDLVQNVEGVRQHISNPVARENEFHPYDSENHNQNDQNWTGASSKNSSDMKVLSTIYYENSEPNYSVKVSDNGTLDSQHRINEGTIVYNPDQNINSCHAYEETQYYNTNIATIQSDSANKFCLQSLSKLEDYNEGYINDMQASTNVSETHDTYTSTQGTFSTNNAHTNYQYSYANDNQRSREGSTNAFNTEPSNDIPLGLEIRKDVMDRTQLSTNGTLDPFWPKQSPKYSVDYNLENILNIYTSKHVDYTKLDLTSCVYCYTAPIVTQQPVLANNKCSQKKQFVAEHRQHVFSPYWLLYNDASYGLRLANLHANENAEKDDIQSAARESSLKLDAQQSVDSEGEIVQNVWGPNS